jgi:predicted transcriptional regulator
MLYDELREQRARLRISQSELSRRAKVSRYRLHIWEAGGGPPLTDDEIARIRRVLQQEAQHIRHQLAEVEI